MKLYCIKKCFFNGRVFIPGEVANVGEDFKFDPKNEHKYFTNSAEEAKKVIADYDKSGAKTKKEILEENRKVKNAIGHGRKPKTEMKVEKPNAKKEEEVNPLD